MKRRIGEPKRIDAMKRRIGELKRIDGTKRRIGEPKWMRRRDASATKKLIGLQLGAVAILSQTVIVKNRL